MSVCVCVCVCVCEKEKSGRVSECSVCLGMWGVVMYGGVVYRFVVWNLDDV